MNNRLFSLCTPCPDGFTFCREFRIIDFRRAPFALYAPSSEAARDFLGQHLPRLAGVILIPGEHLSSEEVAPLVSQIVISPVMLPYLADFAAHQLVQLERRISSEESRSFLALENERLELNNQRASEEFSRFRSSLLHEIEERRAAERQLVESEELLRLIMSSTVEAIYGINTEGLCTFANESCLKILGYDHIGEVLGRNMHELIHYRTPEGLPMPQEQCRIFKAFSEGVGVTVTDEFFLRRDGSSLPVEYSSYPIRKDGVVVGAVVTWRDITGRRLREEMLKESEAKFRSLVENSIDVIFVLDAKGVFRFVSPSWEKHFGYPASEVMNHDFAPFVHADDVGPCFEYLVKVMGTGEAATSPIYRVRHSDGGWRSFVANGSRYPGVSGEPLYLGIGRDVTDQLRAAEEHLIMERQLLHAQKLESLGVMAGGIAHDFNNILTAIIGNADLALKRIGNESPVTENLRRIEQAAARAAELAKQMLAYSGKGKFVVEHIDLNRLLEEMQHMLEISISRKTVLRFNLAPSLPTLEADATQMRQIIMNLVINASEAIGDKSGVIAINTGCQMCDRNYLKNILNDESLAEGEYVCLEITDTGCGMDRDTVARIYDPFFTTKFTGRGLGMAAVQGIVRGHKGGIKVYSEPGMGSAFKIFLPASGRPAEIASRRVPSEEWHGSGTVLLVDDEESVRDIGSEMLTLLGFQVITAEDGRDALEKFESNPAPDFVILDLTMPRMDGEQCFRELRQLKRDVRVIMSSGYNEQDVTRKFVGKGLAGFIQKPYKLSELKEAIMRIGNS